MVPSSHGLRHLQRTVGHETARTFTTRPRAVMSVFSPTQRSAAAGEGRGHINRRSRHDAALPPAHTHSASSAGQPPEMPNSASERS